MIEKECPECHGYRLKNESLAVTVGGLNIVDITNMSIQDAFNWIKAVEDGTKVPEYESSMNTLFDFKKIDPEDDAINPQEREIGTQIFKEISTRLNFLISVGLEYLTLSRTARTLSGGESQRIRLA